MTETTKAERRNVDAGSASHDDPQARVETCIHERLSSCSYKFYFSKIQWQFEKGRLTLNGSVPNFYMKQMLQTLLRDIEHVKQIVNNADVVNSTGLSSVRPK